ncbi:MAG: class I SAM-dependent methyltransferase [Deltaproteobacteria bacterium]|nr:class I SAM-dependent methyltransferase [Deltaproteobacteria bacterium]
MSQITSTQKLGTSKSSTVLTDGMGYNFAPYTADELWAEYQRPVGSINKHLLTLHSLVVGLQTQRAVDIGIGSTTRAIRGALKATGGKLFSCDIDAKRYASVLEQTDPSWELTLGPSTDFLRALSGPFEFAMHDGAHDYWQVVEDLKLLIPKMKQFGVICIHDTQLGNLEDEMLAALRDGCAGQDVSIVHLPYVCGLTIIRVEGDQGYGAVAPLGKDFQNPTVPATCGIACFPNQGDQPNYSSSTRAYQWLWWRFRRGVGSENYQRLRSTLHQTLGDGGFSKLRHLMRNVLKLSG